MIEQQHLFARVAQPIENGTLRTTIGINLGNINAANMRQAHALIEGGHTVGKIVLSGF